MQKSGVSIGITMKRFIILSYKTFLHIFALAGFILVAGFFAVKFNWTDVEGEVDENSKSYTQVLGVETEQKLEEKNNEAVTIKKLESQIEDLSKAKETRQKNICAIENIGKYAPKNAERIIDTYEVTDCDSIITKMVLAASIRISESRGDDILARCSHDYSRYSDSDFEDMRDRFRDSEGESVFPWMNNQQWETIKQAIARDGEDVERASAVAHIEPRLLVSSAIVEQVRLFHSQRELFERFFEPLKILGNSNKMSWGVMGIKEKTAIETENHLKDKLSEYYLGPELENALDFKTGDHEKERYDRLTTEGEYYYSYLYGALYLKQMLSQWERAGYDIKYRPEIVGTLFNVGFSQSKPKADPQVGGSNITVQDVKYSFGSLAYEFYYSGELLEKFPFVLE